MKFIIGIFLALLLSSCSQAPAIQTIEITRVVPQKIEVTRIVPLDIEVTRIIQQTVLITQINQVIITATPKPATVIPSLTSTFGPTHTQAPTKTPIPPYVLTQTAQAALDVILQADKRPGFYLVNTEIAPGVWRSTPGLDDCYWKRTDKTGEIIDNYYGISGVTVYIDPSDFAIQMDEECGTWTYLSPP